MVESGPCEIPSSLLSSVVPVLIHSFSLLSQGEKDLGFKANLTHVCGWYYFLSYLQDVSFNQSLGETIYKNEVRWMVLKTDLSSSNIYMLKL